MDIRFHPESLPYLHLIWLAPALGLLYLFSFHRRRRALELFARTELLGRLMASVNRGRQVTRCLLVLGGLGLIAVAIARPQWGTEVQRIERRGLDLVVLLDLSRSMMAEERGLSRLERARSDLKDLLTAIQGDRIGLVAFAGRAQIACPLTFDYGFFHHILDDLEIGSVSLGGTSIAAAIHAGLECFQDEIPNHKAMLLITDGEDHEAFVREAAEAARKRNVVIFAVGIGDSREGRRIPIIDENGNRRYLQGPDGELVWSRLNPVPLQTAVSITGGSYVEATRGSADLVRLYEENIGRIERRELEGQKEDRHRDRYQWFLGLGLLLLALEPLVPTRQESPEDET